MFSERNVAIIDGGGSGSIVAFLLQPFVQRKGESFS